jgi:hypothetical protein
MVLDVAEAVLGFFGFDMVVAKISTKRIRDYLNKYACVSWILWQ